MTATPVENALPTPSYFPLAMGFPIVCQEKMKKKQQALLPGKDKKRGSAARRNRSVGFRNGGNQLDSLRAA
jgi:hypothetical protein